MLDVARFAEEWTDAWNRRDLESILVHFAEHATFTSVRAKDVTGAARVEGKAALRAYWGESLRRIGSLEFQVLGSHWDHENRAMAIRFRRAIDGHVGHSVEWLRFGSDGLVTEGEGYHGPELSG